jgi:hypothetical protein
MECYKSIPMQELDPKFQLQLATVRYFGLCVTGEIDGLTPLATPTLTVGTESQCSQAERSSMLKKRSAFTWMHLHLVVN